MKKSILFYFLITVLLLNVSGQIKKRSQIKSKAKIPLRIFAVNFKLKNITAPRNISCGEPFLVLSVEVWNVGTKDYNPANGMAELYGDLHDARNNNPITFGRVSMDKIIKKGEFQRWTFKFTRNGLPSVFKDNFNKAIVLKNAFFADEGGITDDPDFRNNIGYTRRISTKCKPVILRRANMIRWKPKPSRSRKIVRK